MTKVNAKAQAIALRKAGYSYGHIAETVNVSKGTLSIWLARVPYRANAQTIARIGKARAASGEAKSRVKRDSISHARAEADLALGPIAERDFFILGLGLYIGEGTKSGQQVRFVNSDIDVMRTIVQWFAMSLRVPKENFRVRLYLYPNSDIRRSLQFWSKAINIPSRQFLKTQIDGRKGKMAIKEGLHHGTAHLTVNSAGDKRLGSFLARKIEAWSDTVLSRENSRD